MNKENHKNTIALDFDGVIHSYISGQTGDYPEDPPNHGTEEALQKLIDEGFELKIYSTRSKNEIKKCFNFK